MRFRPHWLSVVLYVPSLILLVNLGLWQLRRYDVSEVQRVEVESRLAMPPATNADLTQAPEQLRWREALIQGRYLEQSPALISGRFERGTPGFDVIQPFVTVEGIKLLVDRGWVPMQDWNAQVEALAPTGDVVLVRGLLLPGAEMAESNRSWLTGPITSPVAANAQLPERWPRGEYPAIATSFGLDPSVMVLTSGAPRAADAQPPATPLPIDGYVAVPKHIPHREYAGQWFSFAIILSIVWAILGVHRGRSA